MGSPLENGGIRSADVPTARSPIDSDVSCNIGSVYNRMLRLDYVAYGTAAVSKCDGNPTGGNSQNRYAGVPAIEVVNLQSINKKTTPNPNLSLKGRCNLVQAEAAADFSSSCQGFGQATAQATMSGGVSSISVHNAGGTMLGGSS